MDEFGYYSDTFILKALQSFDMAMRHIDSFKQYFNSYLSENTPYFSYTNRSVNSV